MRPIIAAVVLTLAATACTIGAEPEATLNRDLSDPATLDALGLPRLEGVIWERTIRGVPVKGLTSRVDPFELELIDAALAEVPATVLQKAGLRYIVRVPDLSGTDLHPATTAFARGPDVFFIDRTFQEERAGASRLNLTRILVHELAHVAQFNSLDGDYVDAIIEGRITNTDTSNGSVLVEDFAEAAGWRNTSGERFSPDWTLPSDRSRTSEYGLISPDEDMAESLALVVMGRGASISEDRVSWIEDWLGLPAVELERGTLWVPPGAAETFFTDPLYDEDAVARTGARHVEPFYLALPDDAETGNTLAATITAELRRRGLAGSLDPVADPRVPRFAGRFTRSDGLVYWVELWDFRSATGFSSAPDGPILSYVVLW